MNYENCKRRKNHASHNPNYGLARYSEGLRSRDKRRFGLVFKRDSRLSETQQGAETSNSIDRKLVMMSPAPAKADRKTIQ